MEIWEYLDGETNQSKGEVVLATHTQSGQSEKMQGQGRKRLIDARSSGQPIIWPKKVTGNHQNIRIVVELSSKGVQSISFQEKAIQCRIL